jgi:hypothetical protein
MSFAGKVAYAVGTGRCGTYMVYQLLKRDPGVAASHERDVFTECFHRYCAWYGLPVDEAAFLATKRAEIEGDLATRALSFEASAPLSFSIPVLHRAFGARFVLFVRNPVDVVNSYLSKRWFQEEIHWDDTTRAPGYHPEHEHPHHSFGRLMPMGAGYEAWRGMGRVGKLAWTWATVNRVVLDAFRALPAADTLTLRLENFDYAAYQRLAGFLGRPTVLEERGFLDLVGSRPNARPNKPSLAHWTAADAAQFLAQAGDLAAELGYVVDVSAAGSGAGVAPAPRPAKPYLRRLRRGVREAVAAFRAGVRQPAD